MDLFMPAERVLYDRAYYLSDEAERDYAFEVAEEHGIDVGEVLYSDELMKEVRHAPPMRSTGTSTSISTTRSPTSIPCSAS